MQQKQNKKREKKKTKEYKYINKRRYTKKRKTIKKRFTDIWHREKRIQPPRAGAGKNKKYDK